MWGGAGASASAWCGACLATGVRLLAAPGACALGLVALQEGKGMPQKLCFECAASVSRFHSFQRKSERAHQLLRQMYEQHNEITESRIKSIDRVEHNLISSYTISATNSFELVLNGFEADSGNNRNSESEFEGHYIEFDLDNVKKEEQANDFTEFEECDEKDSMQFDDTKDKDGLERNEKGDVIDRVEFENGSKDRNLLPTNNDGRNQKRFLKDVTKGAKPRKHKAKYEKDGNSKGKCSKGSVKRKAEGRAAGKVKHQRKADPDKRLGKKQTAAKLSAKKSCESFATVVAVSHGEQMEEIRKRQETESFRKSQYKCTLCYKGFMEEKAYYNHRMKHEVCDVCKIRFRQKRHVRNHIYAVHMTKYVCKICVHVSTSLEQATNHHKWHAGVTYKCHICGEVSNKVTTHLSHVRLKHPSPHICRVCGRSFVSDKGLTMHRRLVHKDARDDAKPSSPAQNIDSHECADCNVAFTSLSAWKQHMVLSHRDLKEFGNGCRHCGETFVTADEYREHYRLAHKQHRHKKYGNKTWDRPKQCEHCGEQVRSGLQYYWHIRQAHPGQRYPTNNKFVCELCGRDFKFNASLTYHRREHSGELPHRCAACPRAFPTRAQLDKHSSVHSDERPHVCHLCPKAFKEKSALTRHIRNHSGVRPYPCQTCGKAFTEASSRKLHYRTVHLKLPAPYVSKARLKRRLAKTEAIIEDTFN